MSDQGFEIYRFGIGVNGGGLSPSHWYTSVGKHDQSCLLFSRDWPPPNLRLAWMGMVLYRKHFSRGLLPELFRPLTSVEEWRIAPLQSKWAQESGIPLQLTSIRAY